MVENFNPEVPTLNILDMFSGSGNWVKDWRTSVSFNVHIDSVDNCENFYPLPHINHIMDIRDFKPTVKEYHIVYASPPCNKYFSKIKGCNKKVKITEKDIEDSLELAELSFSYAKKAKFCFVIENPATGKMVKHYPEGYKVVDYSEYGFPMRKRTAIWSNLPLNLKIKKEISYNRLPLHYLGDLEKSAIPIELAKYIKRIIIRTFNTELQEFKVPGFEKPQLSTTRFKQVKK